MNHIELTPKLLANWSKWLDANPEVRELAEKFPFYKLYHLKKANQKVYPISYGEDGRMRVAILKKFNPNILFERNVFGIESKDLYEIT